MPSGGPGEGTGPESWSIPYFGSSPTVGIGYGTSYGPGSMGWRRGIDLIGPPAGGYGSSRGRQAGVGTGVGGLGSPAAATFAAENESVAWASGTWRRSQVSAVDAITGEIRQASADGGVWSTADVKAAQSAAVRADRAAAARAGGVRWGRTGQVQSRGPGISSRGAQPGISDFAVPIGLPAWMRGPGTATNIRETAEGRRAIRAQERMEVARLEAVWEGIREEDRLRRTATRVAEVLGLRRSPVRRRLTNPGQHYGLPAPGYSIKG